MALRDILESILAALLHGRNTEDVGSGAPKGAGSPRTVIEWMKDDQGRYCFMSPEFIERFGIASHRWYGKSDFDIWPRDTAEQARGHDVSALSKRRAFGVLEELPNPDGSRSWWFTLRMPSLLPSGKRYVWGGGIELAPTDLDRDRTRQELTRSREELLRSEAQLQELAHRLISAQDDERRRIAGELHDDFSQRIAALIFELHQLERHRPLTPESLHEAVAPLKKGLETLSDDIHHLAYSLHPMLLQHVGLDSAIQDHIARVSDRTGLRIVFQSDGPAGPIPLDQSTCVFRIVQESLHNIVKYAHATEVHVSLKVSSHGLGLSVTDNGIGFDPHRVREGLGLRSMKERLHALYGAFQLVSRPGQGTRVCAWIPAPIPNEPPST